MRVGRTLTHHFEIETRQYDLLGIDLGEGARRRMIIFGAVIILVWTGGLLSYAAAVGWGLVGAIVGTLGAGQPILTVAAAIGLVIVVAVTAVSRRRSGTAFAERLA